MKDLLEVLKKSRPVLARVVEEGRMTPEEDETLAAVLDACSGVIEAQSAALTLANARIARLEEALKTSAARDVLAERERQQSAEGWTPEHDDQHDRGELAAAAACYAHFGWMKTGRAPTEWPWSSGWWKPKDTRHDLVKAGALILAEIERLDRAALKGDA